MEIFLKFLWKGNSEKQIKKFSDIQKKRRIFSKLLKIFRPYRGNAFFPLNYFKKRFSFSELLWKLIVILRVIEAGAFYLHKWSKFPFRGFVIDNISMGFWDPAIKIPVCISGQDFSFGLRLCALRNTWLYPAGYPLYLMKTKIQKKKLV